MPVSNTYIGIIQKKADSVRKFRVECTELYHTCSRLSIFKDQGKAALQLPLNLCSLLKKILCVSFTATDRQGVLKDGAGEWPLSSLFWKLGLLKWLKS